MQGIKSKLQHLLPFIFLLVCYQSIAQQPLPKHLSAASKVEFLTTKALPLNENSLTLPRPFETHIIDTLNKQKRGDYVSVSQQFVDRNKAFFAIYTQGESTGIGEIIGDDSHWYFEVTESGTWMVDIAGSNLLPGLYENDTVHRKHTLNAANIALQNATVDDSSFEVVDILLLFTPNIRDAYPGEMTQTLLNHLVARANQSFVDSGIRMQLRLVGTQFVDYTEPSNFTALDELEAELRSGIQGTSLALNGVSELREQLGADIVAMIRTHNLNERDVCGVAFFPNTQSDVLINISNVGISGGSNCMDTFTHEIGHNFGAGHQRVNGNSVGLLNFSGALIVNGRYNTIMSSIGTGDINRDLGLAIFSNLENNCGGTLCGNANVADNARTINAVAPQNAALREAVSTTTISAPQASSADTDGDNIVDSIDAFPFSALESVDTDGDGVGDNTDAFPFDPNETIDTDNDNIGNNQDTDDDNDGIADINDDLPLDNRDSVDNDGDSFGANRDQLDFNFQEIADADGDGIGDVADPDDDNDGVPDYFEEPTIEQTDAVVMSAGNGSILRFNGATSTLPGGLSFRSDLIVGPGNRLYYIAFSDVLQFDTQSGLNRVTVDRRQLQTNFPAHLLLVDNRLLVNDGLGVSFIEAFELGATGNTLVSGAISPGTLRDIKRVSANTAIVALRDSNQIASFNINNLDNIFTPFINRGLDKPEHIAIDAQGRIFVTNAGTNNITYYSAQGQFLGEFVSSGSGGLGTPSCLTIGPDENLYVCSFDTNQILRYDGSSGAFLDVYISPQSNPILQPVSIQFVSQQQDELPFSGAHDSDGDGVNNQDDAFPLNASRSEADPNIPATPTSDDNQNSGGSLQLLAWLYLCVLITSRRSVCFAQNKTP